MKLENTDRSSSDLRLKATELAERFGEAQREITRLRESLEERQAQVEALAAEKACLEQQALTAATNLAELSAQLSDTEARCTALQTLHAQELHVLMEGKDRELRAGQEVVARLQAELAEANNRARAEEDSADNLDNYKKRAQLALKKVNTFM